MLFVGITLQAFAQGPSVLASGNWYKIAVEGDGVYKISYNFLKNMGVDPAKINPKNIRIYGNPGGMLPQKNSTPRINDLQENAILVVGEADGTFNKNDYILFYATGPDRIEYDLARNIYRYENNLYSDKNFYFLTIAPDAGKRITDAANSGDGFPVINTFNDYVFYENEDHNELQSGREWYGEKFGLSTNQLDLNFPVSGITNSSAIKVVSDIVGQTYTSGTFKVSLNDVQIAEQPLIPIPSTRYGTKGVHDRDTVAFTGSTIGAQGKSTLQLKYLFEKGTGYSQGYLDFFLMSFERELALHNSQTTFVSASSTQNPVSQFQVSGLNDQSIIWDVTDPSNAQSQLFSLSNSTGTFSTSTAQLKKFIAFKETDVPEFIEKISNQNLHELSTPNLIIITHPDFVAEAERLASHRTSFSSWTVQVVTTDQVYHEFSSGRQDVTAIRDFVRNLYLKTSSSLKAVLLFGKCSYDYKGYLETNSNFVPTYESRSSLHPLETYSSDDYFGFLEDAEGDWLERPQPQNHTLEIGVGRLPVKSLEEAKNVVDKIIDYDTNTKKQGYWHKQIAFVADDGNSDDGFSEIHQDQANQLADHIENINPSIDSKKLFMGAYAKTVRPNGETVPDMTDDIVRSFDKGSLLINFTGHGAERQWTDENVFNNTTISELENKLYPFLVTATCEFGRHDNPREVSGAERTVIAKSSGSIGLVTTARPVNSTTNFNLNLAFYNALLQKANNNYLHLGEVFRLTKNNSISGVGNRNFSLLADPSMTLALPADEVHITELKTAAGSDTLKALSKVIAKGEIRNSSNEKITSFNGVVEAALFDKQTKLTTIGRNDPPFEYEEWKNILFRGKASVVDGEFQVEFMLPKNIAYQVGQGKLSLYASDPESLREASGNYSDFKVGESENMISDNLAPEVRLFMGDTTFLDGGIVTPDTRLLAELKDDNGINTSSYGIGNSIIAILDDGVKTFILNDYYVANTDDYTSGWVDFPIQNLEPGPHRLTFKAWDVNNNSTQSTIEFKVTEGEGLRVETFGNYPNPFVDKTTLFFTHNRTGDELQAQVFIQKATGEVVGTSEIYIPDSSYRVDLLEISSGVIGDKKLSAGLYLARLIVRSLTNGSKNERVTKLIILN